jgi:hypothetical protein
MQAEGVIKSLEQARAIIKDSFSQEVFKPA